MPIRTKRHAPNSTHRAHPFHTIYDANSNLLTKTDARSIATTYSYDALNRVNTRFYTDEPSGSETPDVTYYYDNLTNAKGKLLRVMSSVSTTEYASFDILGRVTASKQTTDGQDYVNGYAYNLSGALIEQTYPSGRVVKNILDGNGDLSVVQSKKNSSSGYWNYANSFTYNSAGAVTSMQLGNGRWESTTFNSRLQPTKIALGTTQSATNLLDLDFTYGTTGNNGNVLSQTITVPGLAHPFIQNYSYDSLNRLSSAVETNNSTQTWKQTFTYDRYGNRRFDEVNTTVPASFETPEVTNPNIDSSNNRLSSSGWSYDPSGNTTDDPSARTFVYDAENKQVSVSDRNGTIGEYFYDGDGKRVKKVVPSTGETTIFVYDAAGKLIAEYSTVVASSNDAKVAYLTSDHLGSPRINTDANGTITARHDYLPFGEEAVSSLRTNALGFAGDTVRKQFCGYERDNETDLDFVEARMYVSSHGRFSSPDPSLIKKDRLIDPQRLNRYVYVRDNPLKYKDVTGEDVVLAAKTDGDKKTIKDALAVVAKTKSGREFLQKLEDSKITYNLGVNDATKMRDGTPTYGRNKLENDGTVTVQINPKQIEADNKENESAQKVNDNLMGAAPPKPLPVPDAPSGKTPADRNAVVLANELIQGNNRAEKGDRTNQTESETQQSIPQATAIVKDKEKAKGDATKFVDDILKPKQP
ncbi:MAG: hypothetical protein DMF63_15225 [Acidobacteria bacterium]|nr:MAG: hypothetical protein DMF63_15225 [Acidobacteriota bacterium]